MNRPDIDYIEKWVAVYDSVLADDCAELIAYIRELEAANKRIEHETAFKCAYLAWQGDLSGSHMPERAITNHYKINLDSLYAARWKDLEKK